MRVPLKARYRHLHLICLVLGLSLPACNMPQSIPPTTPGLGITQAYETVAVRLTEAANQVNAGTTLPTESGIQATLTSTITDTILTSTPSPLVTEIQVTNQACDQAAAANPIDVTIPDDSIMVPDQAFTKIWRVQNIGTCTWTGDYAVVFFSGEQMSAPSAVPLNGQVAPGQFIDIAVDMVAPQQSGSFQGNWKLRNANNILFGIGPNSSAPFWVRISVVQTQTPTSTLLPVTPTSSPTVTPPPIQVQGQVSLQLDDRWDADGNSLNPEEGEDFLFALDPDGKYTLFPQGSALLVYFADQQPSLEECLQEELSTDPLQFDSITPANYFCYHTSQGLPGWMNVIVLNTSDETLTLAFLTWNLP